MAIILFLVVVHEIAYLISMLFRRAEEIQQIDLDFGKSATGCGDNPEHVVSANHIIESLKYGEVCGTREDRGILEKVEA